MDCYKNIGVCECDECEAEAHGDTDALRDMIMVKNNRIRDLEGGVSRILSDLREVEETHLCSRRRDQQIVDLAALLPKGGTE